MTVKRRHILYVPGYDPRGLAEYYRLFRSEYRKACALYGLEGHVSRVTEEEDRHAARWTYSTRGADWQVETTYEFLRWEHIIRKDFARPVWWKIRKGYAVFGRSVLNGVWFRLLRAHWRFGLFIAYPYVLMLLYALGSSLVGWLLALLTGLTGLPSPITGLIGLAAAIALFIWVLRKTEPQTYLLYLFDDGISTRQYSLGERTDWHERMEIFAGYVVDTARTSDADEIVVVGHSSGSFLAIEVMDRALARDPQLGRHGPRVALLTIGANLPIVGFHPEARDFRERIRRLAINDSFDWVDYQSRHDIMNFWPFDPVTDHRIDAGSERRNPTVIPISFRDLWIPGDFGRRRWRFFRAHFQFLMANERRGAAYDYYLICCGPYPLAYRAQHPDEAVRAMESQHPARADLASQA
ncbi:MAG TPA: hypothetical protein VFB45_09800 [Pseudolabrys sp.]|nr:hypothetical protein [Pseudolabrys sp.]